MKPFSEDEKRMYGHIRKETALSSAQQQRLERQIMQAAAAGETARGHSLRRPVMRVLAAAACTVLAVGTAMLFRTQPPEPEWVESRAEHTHNVTVITGETDTRTTETETTVSSAEEKPVSTLSQIGTTTAAETTTRPSSGTAETVSATGRTETQATLPAQTTPPQTQQAQTTAPPPVSDPPQSITTLSELPPEITELSGITPQITEDSGGTASAGTEPGSSGASSQTEAAVTVPEPVPPEGMLVMPHITAHAGQTVIAELRFQEDVAFAGIQINYQLAAEPSGAALPVCRLYGGGQQFVNDLNRVTVNFTDNAFRVVWADKSNAVCTAGELFIAVEITIPENVPAGTVYTLAPGAGELPFAPDQPVLCVNDQSEEMLFTVGFGQITVTE